MMMLYLKGHAVNADTMKTKIVNYTTIKYGKVVRQIPKLDKVLMSP